jgi:nucleotide-binding universal stress UspA family protein
VFTRILVGVDGLDGGRDAVRLAEQLRGRGGQLTLAYVYPGRPYVWEGGNPAYWPVEEEQARQMLEATQREAGVKAATMLYSAAPPVGRGLHSLAEELGADLLVVGSSRRGLLGRVMLGDDTRATLAGAPCAVAVAPLGYAREGHALHEIGVAYNGSPESEHALAVARRLAAAHGAHLSAFEAISVPVYVYMGTGVPGGDTIEAMVAEARHRIEQLGVVPHAAYGDPAEELAIYSGSLDLLVVGSRGYGPLRRLMHGSTSQELARRARCPLLVLTRAARAADTPLLGEDSATGLTLTPGSR